MLSCRRSETPLFSISGQILLAPKFENRNQRRPGLAFTGPLTQGQPTNVNDSATAASASAADAREQRGGASCGHAG